MSIPALLCFTVVYAHLEVRPAGWLDRAAAYYKQKFFEDLDRFAPVKIHATIEQAPPGYVDSKLWDYDTVMHLLNLIRESDTAAPVRDTLRRALRPTRRFMSRAKSFKHFPSLIKKNSDIFYYDIESDIETDTDMGTNTTKYPEDNDIIVVSNPVEARLPSAQISVKLLRQIMEARALAGRIISSTKRSTIYWKPMNMTKEGHKTTEGNVTTQQYNSTNTSNTTITTITPNGNDTTVTTVGGKGTEKG